MSHPKCPTILCHFGYKERTDKALEYLQSMEHQKLGKVSQADADRAADKYQLPSFDLTCVPADFETDKFVQACHTVKATPGTRIAQVSSQVEKMINAKKYSRAKKQRPRRAPDRQHAPDCQLQRGQE